MDIVSTRAALNYLKLAKSILKFDQNVTHEDLDAPIKDLCAQLAEDELMQQAQRAGMAA